MKKLSKAQLEEIKAFRGFFPKSVQVHADRSEDGGFYAEIKSFPGVVTQADNFPELISMVNDAVRTFYEIPEKYVAFMPNYMPPVKLAIELDFMPGQAITKDFRLDLAVREEAAS